ncbi:MAG: FAD-binding oxidoreductase [Bryobacteraceae bacterium]
MPDLVVNNWFGDLTSRPSAIAEAHSLQDIVAVLKDPGKYPSPIRAVGSNHSTTPCGVVNGGTIIKMKMNRILNIGSDSLTVEAGAILIDLAKQLEARGLQFYVNTEIGNLSAGSAACAGTKDSSMPGEYGQVGSYITGVKMVLPGGDLLEVTEDKNPELMQQIRSSYGTFSIIYEVTYRVRPLIPLAVHHKTYSLEEFVAELPNLKTLGYSMMFYIFPFDDKITVEFRRYNPNATGEPNRTAWALRNHIWGTSGPKLAHDIDKLFPDSTIRHGVLDKFNVLWRFQLENLVASDNTRACDQIIRYPTVSNDSRYTFSLFAFPEEHYPETLKAFFQFSKNYYWQKGYRVDLLDVGYWISRDQKALLSYSWSEPIMTIDPVSTGGSGWSEFLGAYNQFCSEQNGKPLLNQTPGLTPAILQKASGDRLQLFAKTRRSYDPGGRLLTDYFKALLGE